MISKITSRKKVMAVAGATSVGIVGLSLLPSVFGGFTATINGTGNSALKDMTMFSMVQTGLTEGGTSILANAQAETVSTASLDATPATYSFAANSLLPKYITPDPNGYYTRASTLKFTNKTTNIGLLTTSVKTLTMSSYDPATGVANSAATLPGDLVNMKFTDNGADGTFGTADDAVLFNNTVNAFLALGNAGFSFALEGSGTRYVTVESTSLAQDLSTHMGQQIDLLDLKFSLSGGAANSEPATVEPNVPGAPSGLAGDGSVTVAVTAPTGGGAPASYTVTASPGGQTCTVTSPSTSCVVTGLTNGTAYTFTATATNAMGTSAASVASAPVTPTATVVAPGTPGTPTAIAGNASATVTVAAPTTGGAPASYTVTASPGGQTCTVTSPSTSCVVTGLTNGTAYTFTSKANNTAGSSASSAASASVTPFAPEVSPWSPVNSTFTRTTTGGDGPVVVSGAPLDASYYFTGITFSSAAEQSAFASAFTNYNMHDILAVTANANGTGSGSWMTAGKTYYYEIHNGTLVESGGYKSFVSLTGRVYYDGSWHTLPNNGTNINIGSGASQLTLALYRNSIGDALIEAAGGNSYDPGYLGSTSGSNFIFNTNAFSMWDSTAQSTWSASHPVLMISHYEGSYAYVTLAAAQDWKANDTYAANIVRTSRGGYHAMATPGLSAYYALSNPWFSNAAFNVIN